MKKYVYLKIPVPALPKTTIFAILLLLFSLYSINSAFYLYEFDNYFRIIMNAIMLIATALIFVKATDAPENHSTRFKIIAHTIIFILMLMLPLLINILAGSMITPEEISGIGMSIWIIKFFNFTSANELFQFLWGCAFISVLTSIIIALITVYKHNLVHSSIVFHAIVNITFASAFIRWISNLQSGSLVFELLSPIFVCGATVVLAVIILIISRRIRHIK